MTVAEKLTRIAENERRVYDAGVSEGLLRGGYDAGVSDGRAAEYDAFWDAVQWNGARTHYPFGFSANLWTQESFRPKHPIRPTNAQNMCAYWGNGLPAADLSSRMIDLRGIALDFSQCTEVHGLFYANRAVTAVGTLDLRAVTRGYNNLFALAANLHTVEMLYLREGQVFKSAFEGCTALEEIRFGGLISEDVDLQWSTKLSCDSIDSLFRICNESQGYDFKVTLSRAAVNRAYETGAGANDGSESEEWLMAVNYSHQTVILA